MGWELLLCFVAMAVGVAAQTARELRSESPPAPAPATPEPKRETVTVS